MGVGYGFLSMIKTILDDLHKFSPFEPKGKLQLNLAHKPEHTFLFDQFNHTKLEDTLDRINFFCDLEEGIRMKDFIT